MISNPITPGGTLHATDAVDAIGGIDQINQTEQTAFQRGALKTEVPRHSEIVDDLARKICKDLAIPFVR